MVDASQDTNQKIEKTPRRLSEKRLFSRFLVDLAKHPENYDIAESHDSTDVST